MALGPAKRLKIRANRYVVPLTFSLWIKVQVVEDNIHVRESTTPCFPSVSSQIYEL
jgi:hypothetical protein